MHMTKRLSRSAVSRPALAAFLAASAFAPSMVQAQQAEPPLVDRLAEDETAASRDEGIVVTASRVRSSGFSAPTPLTVLGAEQIEAVAPTQVQDILALVPSFRTTGQPASATTYADLRGIGAQRTLVLVDGRRHVPTFSDGTVDLGVIPTILIARTEVVTGGASASWGSDAVAGVINLILKSDLEGVEGTAQAGISDYGDAENYLLSLAAGSSFAGGRGHILIGGEYAKDEGIRGLQQPNVSRPWAGRGSVGNAAFATNGQPGTIYDADVRRADVSQGGLITSGPLRGLQFGPGGATSRFGFGQVYGNNMIGGTDNFADAPTPGGDLKFPSERFTLMGRADFDVTDSLSVFAEGTFARVLSSGLAQPARNNGAVTGNPTCTSTLLVSSLGSIQVPISNPFLPAAVRQQMQTAGVTCFNMGRVFLDPGMGEFTVRDGSPAIYRGVLGAEGALSGTWRWDAYVQVGRNRFEQRRIGNVDVAKFRRAIDAVQVGATVACRVNTDASTTNDDPACQPFNLFGSGSPSSGAIDYVTGTSEFDMVTKQKVAAVSLNGDLVTLWAGPVSAAFGAEYRKEEIDAVADPVSEANGWHSSNRKAITGAYSVKEVFGELAVPLLRDLPFASSLDLNVAARYTDYSSSGGVTTWKVGATWDVTDAVRLRATRSRDIRAGNLGELFTPTAVLVTNVRDPRTSAVLPVPVTTQGNRSLSPERADTLTAGAVYQPGWLPGIRLSVDYYDITIDGQIGSLAADDILRQCFLDNVAVFCDAVTTGTNGQIVGIIRQFENLDSFETSGIDFELAYQTSVGDLFSGEDASLNLRLLANYTDKLATTAALSGATTDVAGQFGTPHWTVFGTARYSGERFGTTLDLRWYEGGAINNLLVEGLVGRDGVNTNSVSPTLYTNVTADYDFSPSADGSLQIFARVSNLFNKAPPFPVTGEGRSLYDPTGRSYRAGIRFKF
jgi:outer membrane receptor protein involved in Fe transport